MMFLHYIVHVPSHNHNELNNGNSFYILTHILSHFERFVSWYPMRWPGNINIFISFSDDLDMDDLDLSDDDLSVTSLNDPVPNDLTWQNCETSKVFFKIEDFFTP